MRSSVYRAAPVLLLSLGVAACEAAIEPNQIEKPVYIQLLDAETAGVLMISATDVVERIVPSLEDGAKLAALRAALSGFNAALVTRKPDQFRSSVEQLRAAFDGYAGAREDAAIDPDIGAIRLLVEHAQYFSVSMPLDSVLAK